MKYVKYVIVLFSLLGLAGVFLPRGEGRPSAFSYSLETDKLQLVTILFMFAVPLLAAGVPIVKRPFERWHAALALGGFLLAALKTRVWKLVPEFAAQPIAFKLIIVAILGGTVASLLGLRAREGDD